MPIKVPGRHGSCTDDPQHSRYRRSGNRELHAFASGSGFCSRLCKPLRATARLLHLEHGGTDRYAQRIPRPAVPVPKRLGVRGLKTHACGHLARRYSEAKYLLPDVDNRSTTGSEPLLLILGGASSHATLPGFTLPEQALLLGSRSLAGALLHRPLAGLLPRPTREMHLRHRAPVQGPSLPQVGAQWHRAPPAIVLR
jgi:hypothetical protein